ncbi:phosphoribosyl pyrophosphate synthase-associated protein 2-like [Rhopalosiphum padi]|uniref:phosphoribosyl pyrophosphate synthase-associated protein 2-like n=1 Tax=Rhopalosiphum padi TaxID=40932 RepID=UPI00298E1C31|nr:phosphoribosyl pyrophosphate synthase-associated protein 2-like [Rhopalosiphum padi]XP_060847526.1 phosphoribosyl pyrophosphate synthase-associated protein 2-like [Rhopalosiphum padi]XP_060847528.1 phosphoribosyl pyrophosphate synthase-associated protein 2-like [Rhopalosiphum padi]
MARAKSTDIMLISGNSHVKLANLVACQLGVKPARLPVSYTTNRETFVQIKESVRGKDIYIIQTGSKDVNNNIMELLIMAYACKTYSAKSIVGVIPYLPYSKQCKMQKRGSIVCKLLAEMLYSSGLTHVITMDLYQKEIQGFFECPVDNLRASPLLLQYIQECIPDYCNAVIVARNPGTTKQATFYADHLRLRIAVIHGEQKESDSDVVDGRNSPPPATSCSKAMDVGVGIPEYPVKEKPPMNIVGDVNDRIAIIVDDMLDDVTSFVIAAEVLKKHGAYKIYVLAIHGILSSDAPRLIEYSPIDEVIVTNTIPHEVQKMQCHKIKTVDISILLSEAIRRIHNKESMSYLFKNVTLED